MRDIPGYYYDEEKKKYFKITKEFLQKQRKNAFKEVAESSKSKRKIDWVRKQNHKDNQCFPCELTRRSILGPCHHRITRIVRKALYEKINDSEDKAFDVPSTTHDLSGTIEAAYFVKFNRDGRCLVVSRPNSLDMLQTNITKDGKFGLQRKQVMDHTSLMKPSMFHWSPKSSNSALFVTNSEKLLRPGFITTSAMVVLDLDTSSISNEPIVKKFNNTTINCCSWCKDPRFENNVVIGEQRKEMKMLHFGNNQLSVQQTVKLNAQPKVIEPFSKLPGFVVGLKSGNISIIDFRRHSDIHCPNLTTYCIDCMKLHQDENYVTFSNWGGSIQTVDLRMRKIISKYNGHVNNACDLEFHFDRYEQSLYAVGADSCMRIWDIKTTKLLYTKRLTSSTSEDNRPPPVITFTENWSGDPSLFGLLYVDRNHAQFFAGL